MARATVIADASHCPHTGAAGFGWWTSSDRGKRGGGGPIQNRVDTSGAAEMIAIVNALHLSLKHNLILKGDHVLFQTDCTSAIAAFESRRSELSGHEKAAKAKFYELKKEHGFFVSFRHVKGHTHNPEARFVTNNLCDKRAKQGMRLARSKLQKGNT